jgi:hypothetical protein
MVPVGVKARESPKGLLLQLDAEQIAGVADAGIGGSRRPPFFVPG